MVADGTAESVIEYAGAFFTVYKQQPNLILQVFFVELLPMNFSKHRRNEVLPVLFLPIITDKFFSKSTEIFLSSLKFCMFIFVTRIAASFH